jgi:hypothetical protein
MGQETLVVRVPLRDRTFLTGKHVEGDFSLKRDRP